MPLLAPPEPLTHIWLTRPGIVRLVARRPLSRFRMWVRRTWTWFRGFSLWSVLALLVGVAAVAIAFTRPGLVQVIAVAALSITLAILATKEEPS